MSNFYSKFINEWGYNSEVKNISRFNTQNKDKNNCSCDNSKKDSEQDRKIEKNSLDISKNNEVDKKQQAQIDVIEEKIPTMKVDGNTLVIS